MSLLEGVGMTPTGKNFTIATAFMCNEQATTYRWILQQIKTLIFYIRYVKWLGRTNWEEGSAITDYWMDTPDHLYVIVNTFYLCIVFLAQLGTTTVLPLVYNMDGNAGTIFIGFIEEQEHFIQLAVHESHWEYSRDSIFSGDCGGGTNPCNHPCRNSVELPEHWSMSLSISAKVPRAILPPQKYSLTRTSCCLATCVPPKAG
ncbi:hypothetical protein M9H77_13553 [Catharanthus roseus]|uniref:Uncharacterized protein n=1 Tax=Catharanthus roseus TaxID=4058 RepID=A0ACC0BKG5_CATRO|nr:hypothetical protein M9H77_13553 [Catharanthus roseus]